ncbi:FtsK/SpoIIIE family DNA translocase [Collinsella aerofaciens]|uniref:FtsK/SpoIIIE family DNA translocase n=1 Tax=Collinsella aerofaciens TaxID=74426 RepID=UPI001E647A17|nr:DNA translocase FtsK [Collinsella aerofaciens]MDB1829006.1 DNA translocase FtsK 4TM domain-containing protein [Collinsella aerofaciens]
MARGSAQNAKGNKANNQPASPKGAGSHLRANKGHEAEFEDFEPLVEPSANRDIAGVVIAVLAIASFIAVISPATAPVTAAVAGFYHLGFGLGAYVLPIVILLFAATLFLGEDSPLNVRSVAGGAVVFIAVVSILSLMVPGTSDSCDLMFTPQNLSASGGYIGAFIASALQNALGKPIAMVVLLGLAVVGFVIIGFSVGGVLRSARDRAADFAERRRADVNASPWGDDEALSVPGVARPHLSILRQKGSDMSVTTVMGNDADPVLDDDDEDEDPFVDVSDAVEAERAKTTLLPRRHAKKGKKAPKLNTSEPDPSWSESEIELTEGDDEDDESPLETAKTTLLPRRQAKRGQVTGQLSMEDDPDKVDESEPPFAVNPVSAAPQIPDFVKHPKVADTAVASAAEASTSSDGGADIAPADNEGEEEDGLKLPPLEILHANPQSASAASSDKELEQTAESLQSTLLEFGRSARVVGWIAGPTVTTFKLQPGEGERVSKISSLEDDIALSLAAQSVRIFAPIPGTSLVGIEIPNRKRQNVNLGDVLPYVKGGPLELAIGRDAEGTPVVADLAKMPHLLIAGTTGSGKSVMINSIITTLLMRALPEDVRLIMVDPKRVELAGYNGLPHLYVPVVTEPKQAASALQWAVSEMERRLKVFERLNVRKISTYNEKQAAGEFEHYDNPPQKMPYLVIIIDELSDLMMVAGKDVEASIVRIAQLGRAAGIHLIVATQRPSSNVVTGLIKANITNRIAFNVATGIDSRVIIDQMGAEKLTGLGDMLFSKVDWGKPRRIQGCFVSDDEINEIVEFVKSQSEPDYHEEILSAVAPASMSMAGGGGIVRTGVAEPQDDDPLIWEAAHIVVESQLGSTSGLQRRLKVGYARAGRIMDMLEEKGVVGPPDGSKPREVLLDEEGLATLESVDAEMAREDREFGGF